ncbi:hypothetical protein [Bacillus sp. S/N-304-OC-R1]|uniref:hypothetical protein n=1 Tax=Bacillus sp. S/N-304-OC-R1 TaxID=2758034 RepID=UPI001C8EE177|nr:hypothetical protein [Bacillus sp. S/N-304-OC-R1]MBY0122297.1 hypothetical protein [Bacillus sp. S/N-304-OC-R1]
MKKKAIKLATSTAIAASAFVAAAPANQAAAAVNVDQLVKAAEATATVLKWSISTEGTANFVDRPYTAYNAAKAANKAAKAEVAKLAGADKAVYEARLLDSDLQIKRAQAYIDALTSGEKIRDKQAALDKAIKAADLKAVQSSYHVLTAEIRKQAELLYKVYGQSTRDGILKTFKDPAEKSYKSVVNEVTVLDHTALVTKYTADKDYAKAIDHVEKAEYALKEVKQFKADLTKSLNDAVDALPLDVVSVSRVDSTTVEVKFTKALDIAPVAHFSFDKGLTVTSTKLSDDSRTVTLTVSGQKADETYTLYYKGEAKKSFTSPKAGASNDAIVGPTNTAYVDAGKFREYTFSIKDTDGKAYRSDVKVNLFDLDADDYDNSGIVSINGTKASALTADGDGYYTVKPGTDGKVTVIITSAAAAELRPEIIKTTSDDVLKGGKTVFVEVDIYNTAATGDEVDYVDSSKDFIVFGTNKVPFDKSSDIFQIKGITVSYDEFKKSLTQYTKVAVDYDPDNSVNIFNITVPLSISVVKVTNPSNGKTARIASGEYYDFRGTGQAGREIRVFEADGTTLVTDDTVSSNGTWSARVAPANNTVNVYKVQQFADSDAVVGTVGPTETVKIIKGAFTVDTVAEAATNEGRLSRGDKIEITFSSFDSDGAGADKYEDVGIIANNTVITFTDKDLKKAVFTVGSAGTKVTVNNDNKVVIQLGEPTKLDSGFDADTVKLSGLTNVKSKDGLSLTFNGSKVLY